MPLRSVRSPDGATTKFLHQSPGASWESVVMRHPSGRTTACLSCQAGCAVGCEFCATGKAGWVRDLTVAEILDQASAAVEELAAEGKRLRNVVFMGMGEPLLNLENLGGALDALVDQRTFEIAPRFISVSTCGVIDAIEPFYRRHPKIKLAVSLHAPRQDLRDRLMPGCRRWPLTELMDALDAYAAHTGHKLFFEYVMLSGVNDGDREASQLVDLLRERSAHVNLIPYNPAGDDPWRASDRATLDRFQLRLAASGIAATVRHSAGDTIAAGCGQLAGKAPSANS